MVKPNQPIFNDFPEWEKGTRVTLGPCARRYRGRRDRRILGVIEDGDFEHTLHATKGIRTQRKASDGAAMAAFLASVPQAKRPSPRYAATVSPKDYLRGGNFNKD